MTLYDQGTTPEVAPMGPTYYMDVPVQLTQGTWAVAQRPKTEPTAPPVVQTYAWGRWGTPLGAAAYSASGVPGGQPALTAGYVQRNGLYGPGSSPLNIAPWTPGPLVIG